MTTDGKVETRRTMISPLWTALGRRFGRGIHVFGRYVLIQLAVWEEIIPADIRSCAPKKAADNEILPHHKLKSDSKDYK